MDINFPLLLVLAVFITGLIALFDRLVLLPKRKAAIESFKSSTGSEPDQDALAKLEKEPSIIETSKSIFPVLALVLVLRSFLFEPFQIPSGSMIPTLQVGDFILVNKFDYGLRLPVIGTKVVSINEPQRGDVMVFKEPANPNINFIKRVIGIPGDKVRYMNKKLTINGQPVPEKYIAELRDEGGPYQLFEETIDGKNHQIRKDLGLRSLRAEGVWVIPEGQYFMMGDNRDRSNDSRYWGTVPEKNIVGKAIYIWMHWPTWTQLPSFKNNGTIE
ncbi:signal peptidase I [Endozoicomonas numazuensis]|uniref:Signal peptidase I n=1 Tax=Endozoicomonas numazuensis TaxID=1137799 RepID=A0A081NHP4_9GAMM|nr:signal peptidase I [Endozoicomonas numazuensis]KEQ17967.1 signal peptidase [Endozoicomonas numazuensis]